MEEEVQLIKKMRENDRAIRDNFAKLRKEHPDQYVAVDNGIVLASADNLQLLKKQIEEKKLKLATLLIEYIPKKGVVVLY